MEKYLLTTLLALLLIAPLAELEAKESKHEGKDRQYEEKDRHDSRHDNRRKFFRFSRATKAELKLLKQAVSEINGQIEALNLQVGGLPSDLATTLAALRNAVETNSGEVAFLLEQVRIIISSLSGNAKRLDTLESAVTDIGVTLARIESTINNLELRVSALELSTPPSGPGVVFTGDFIQGEAPNFGVQNAWKVFIGNATGLFTSIEISNNLGGSAKCSDPFESTKIANALNGYIAKDPTVTKDPTVNFVCDGRNWNVGQFGAGVALSAGPTLAVDDCAADASVRPLVGHLNWGGIGVTCKAPTQTLGVVLTR